MATKTRKPVKRLHLLEDIQTVCRGFQPYKVDVEEGIISDVKVLGVVSDNGRRYTKESILRAESEQLYEGRLVNVNHPGKASETRSAYDRIGKLEGIYTRFENNPETDGLYASRLILLRTHDLAKTVLEAAERMPEAFALSHNADGKGFDEPDGTFVVQQIVQVRSVDIVADGATNKSLFEGRTTMKVKKTLRKVIQESTWLSPEARTRLLEMSPADMDTEYEVDSGPGDAAAREPTWKDHIIKAVGHLVESEDPEDHEMAAKLLGHCKPKTTEEGEEPEFGGGSDIDDEGEFDGETKTKPPKKGKSEEARQPRKTPKGSRHLSESTCHRLCRLAGIEPKRELLEALASMSSGDAAMKLLESLKPQLGRQTGDRPRSQGPAGVSLMEGSIPKETDLQLAFLHG